MDCYTFVLPSENKNAFACSPSAQMPFIINKVTQGHLVDQNLLQRYTRSFEIRRRVLRVKKWRNSKRTHLSLSLSLLVDLSMHFDFPEMMCMYQSLSLSLSIYICKNGLDPDQTRMEFKKECFVNLKICACDRKYAKCRTKADAHDKMDFQYISISVYIVRSHARIQRGERESGPLSNTRSNPLKFSEQPSQHSTLGHHRRFAGGPMLARF